jgi:UDP-N-acetyl-D-galactosamine dehydrogenase
MGIAFKENCPDLRNSKVVDIVSELQACNAAVDIWDPWVSREACRHEYGLDCLAGLPEPGSYDGIVVAVGHRHFVEMGASAIRGLGKPSAVLYDVKGVFPKDATDGRL